MFWGCIGDNKFNLNFIKMKTTKRFDRAVTKLYNAFHHGRLDAMRCTACATGNILGNVKWNGWMFDKEKRNWSNKFEYPENADYSKEELADIEWIFLSPWIDFYGDRTDITNLGKNRRLQFKGLCAVVEYLCELDNIPNVMDYKSLFEAEKDKPKYQLSEIL